MTTEIYINDAKVTAADVGASNGVVHVIDRVLIPDSVDIPTDIVDTAGMDEYSRLSRNASLGVHGYALVFSIISRKSFDTIQQVNDSLLNTLGDAPDVPRVLVGSMEDLTDQRQVSKQVRLFYSLYIILLCLHLLCWTKKKKNTVLNSFIL